MKNIFIIGSCVSRDTFNIENDDFKIVSYNARSSFARQANAKPVSDQYYKLLDNIQSAFQRRMVENDFNNKLPNLVKSIKHDFILIDLIDERFHLAQLDKAIVTRSKEFTLSNIKPDRLINTFSDEYMELWCEGISNFFDNVKNESIFVLPKVYWSTEILGDQKFNDVLLLDIAKQNEKLTLMYKYLDALKINNMHYIDIDTTLLRADPNHRWGLSPFHYGEAYYKFILDYLRAC